MKGLWLAGVLPYATEFYWSLTFLGDRITSIAVKAMAIGQCQTAEIAQEFDLRWRLVWTTGPQRHGRWVRWGSGSIELSKKKWKEGNVSILTATCAA